MCTCMHKQSCCSAHSINAGAFHVAAGFAPGHRGRGLWANPSVDCDLAGTKDLQKMPKLWTEKMLQVQAGLTEVQSGLGFS